MYRDGGRFKETLLRHSFSTQQNWCRSRREISALDGKAVKRHHNRRPSKHISRAIQRKTGRAEDILDSSRLEDPLLVATPDLAQ